jgi:putative FmdB family regulatory protein
MPLFEYRCPSCDTAFEKIVPLDQRDQVACPACGVSPTLRQISSFTARTGGSSPSEPLAPCGKPHAACACCNHRER